MLYPNRSKSWANRSETHNADVALYLCVTLDIVLAADLLSALCLVCGKFAVAAAAAAAAPTFSPSEPALLLVPPVFLPPDAHVGVNISLQLGHPVFR